MSTEHERAVEEHPGHEPLAISIKGVAIGMLGLVVLIGATVLAMLPLMRVLSPRHPADQAEVFAERPVEVPSTVGLNPNQAQDRLAHEEVQRRWLREFAWLDEEEQVARIPIERAMQILQEQGLGTAVQARGASSAGSDPSDGDGGTP